MDGEPVAQSLDRCDPGGVVRAALTGPTGSGLRDLWLGWVLRLPGDVDAAEAATALLAACPACDDAEELRDLLASTADCTPSRLVQLGRRRGGRQGRASSRD